MHSHCYLKRHMEEPPAKYSLWTRITSVIHYWGLNEINMTVFTVCSYCQKSWIFSSVKKWSRSTQKVSQNDCSSWLWSRRNLLSSQSFRSCWRTSQITPLLLNTGRDDKERRRREASTQRGTQMATPWIQHSNPWLIRVKCQGVNWVLL